MFFYARRKLNLANGYLSINAMSGRVYSSQVIMINDDSGIFIEVPLAAIKESHYHPAIGKFNDFRLSIRINRIPYADRLWIVMIVNWPQQNTFAQTYTIINAASTANPLKFIIIPVKGNGVAISLGQHIDNALSYLLKKDDGYDRCTIDHYKEILNECLEFIEWVPSE